MGWVDLDLNLPPPPPDPDGVSPLPSPTPTPLREQDRGGEGFGGEESVAVAVPVIAREREDAAVLVTVPGGNGGDTAALRVSDGEERGKEEEIEERRGFGGENLAVEGRKKVESEEEEDDVISRARGTRIEVDAGGGGEEKQVEEQPKPVRKRLRTLGQLRNQRSERSSPTQDRESPVERLRAGEESGVELKGKADSEEKLERSRSVLTASESSKQLVSQEDEKMQVDGEEGSSESKKKVVAGAKDANSDKRRRPIMMVEGEAPPKRARLPRNTLRKTRSFGGVIVGEKLDEGSNPSVAKASSPQSSETGKIRNKVETRKDSSEIAKKQSGNSSRAVEMSQQQVDSGATEVVAEGSGATEEEKPRDAGLGVTVPRRPRKMKEITVLPTRAPRTAKPPPAVKATEFIRPTVKKPSTTIPLSRPSSAGGNNSRSDMRAGFQDTSMERLQREATSSKLWQSAGNADLQQVPGSFSCVEDYAQVLEPLLFEECRAQLHNNWEELLEGTNGDPHAAVTIKMHERKERGWYDVVLMPMDRNRELRFKEGDVAVLSTPKPGTGIKRKGRLKDSKVESAEEGQVAGRVAGIVRRYTPIDVRDPPGAILRFHLPPEEQIKQSSEEAECITNPYHTLQQIQAGGALWYLTVIGGFTTIQREYSALHQLPNFRPQMMNAILKPRPELFPGHPDIAPPPMPDCFTPPFLQHLNSSFNAPQLAAIQWAAAHTAAGSTELNSSSSSGGQPWPFTLVQGPPGTGKTHTVWGMLNVIHLVQYQRYYAALLKKLAPGSVSADEYPLSGGGEYYGGGGTIDDVLQKMDNNLARVLPKLCPKPRMLVCAPSNAATDELLSRVLARGFIDGEMKRYNPDVARVGVETFSAQAVSVEKRTETLLAIDHTNLVQNLKMCRTELFTLNQTVMSLQKDLIDAANSARSQGNLGVDPEVLAFRDQMRDGKLQQLAAVVEQRDKVLVDMSRLFIVEVKFRPGNNFRIEDVRRKLEASYANEAEIVFTTVSSSGRKIFSQLQHGFDMVVIDEAAQASEVAVLPPLSLRAARCVLVGDPQQLPATVISRAADTMKYSRSLFERFQQAGCPAILLSVQYRMHPQIRDFPSRYFYQGKLVDSESVRGLKEEIYYKDAIMKPYLFFDISLGKESHAGSVSYQNKMEAQVAVNLYQHLLKTLADEAAASGGSPANVSVGMITPYKQQMQCLEKEFLGTVGANAASKGVYINTVDAFQGQERDVIMMSCVRASGHGVGFVADIRRMNVALTRARRSLWVIGNASALTQSEDWAALLSDAKDRGCFISSNTCIQRGLLPEPASGPPGAPLGSHSFLHPRPGGPMSRGRGMGSYGGRHSSPGRHHYNTYAGEGSHRRGRSNAAMQDRGPDERELWQRPPFDRSCRGQRDGPRPPGFGPQFQHPNRRNKGL